MMFTKNNIVCAESESFMKTEMPENCIDLTITSPPYDDIRDYKGYVFNAKGIIEGLYKITKKGGVVIWVVGDRTVNGDRSLNSFKHAFHARDAGFLIHDVMVYQKLNFPPWKRSTAYTPAWELMYVFSKGIPKTFNPIKIPTQYHKYGKLMPSKISVRQKDGSMKKRELSAFSSKDDKNRGNVWGYKVGRGLSTKDKAAYGHPAMFPEDLAEDHIKSWTNKGDLVFDPMCGSGTTCVKAAQMDRDYFGIDISEEYVQLAIQRIGVPLF